MAAGAPCGRGCSRARRCRACRRRALRRRLRRRGRTDPRHIEGLAAMALDDRASRVVAREHSQGISCPLGGGSVAACCPAAMDPNLRDRRKPAPSTHLLRGGVLSRQLETLHLTQPNSLSPPPPRPDQREKGAERLGTHASGGARVAVWAVYLLQDVQLRSVCGAKSLCGGAWATRHSRGLQKQTRSGSRPSMHAPPGRSLCSRALAVHEYECCILCQRKVGWCECAGEARRVTRRNGSAWRVRAARHCAVPSNA